MERRHLARGAGLRSIPAAGCVAEGQPRKRKSGADTRNGSSGGVAGRRMGSQDWRPVFLTQLGGD